jgi:hypothetical protein
VLIILELSRDRVFKSGGEKNGSLAIVKIAIRGVGLNGGVDIG